MSCHYADLRAPVAHKSTPFFPGRVSEALTELISALQNKVILSSQAVNGNTRPAVSSVRAEASRVGWNPSMDDWGSNITGQGAVCVRRHQVNDRTVEVEQMDNAQRDEANQENSHSRSDDEECWSIEATRGGSSNSEPETTPPPSATFTQDARGSSIHPQSRRLVPCRANVGSAATASVLNSLDLNADTDSRFRGLTPPPLPLGVVPTPKKKRSLGTMLKDDTGIDGPQHQDKLSKELETMVPSYGLRQRDDRQNNFSTNGPETRPGSSYALGHRESSHATPRTVPWPHSPMDEAPIPRRRQDRAGSALPVSVAEQEDTISDPASSRSAPAS